MKSIQPERTTFDVFAYMAALAKIWHSNISFDVRMRQVVVELTKFDPALYSYANIVKGFRDEFSITRTSLIIPISRADMEYSAS